ncbi:MAG: hypothetical protein V1813_03015 [Candidatus Aenigmatarchaeota archaeon]
MIDFFLSLLRESPLLFMVLIANLLLVAYIAARLSLYFVNRKKPGRTITHFISKMKAKKGKQDVKTIEDVYGFVMESMRKEGSFGRDQEAGFAARRSVLGQMEEGEKRAFMEELFGLYEAKVYGNKGVRNEERVASDMLGKFAGL